MPLRPHDPVRETISLAASAALHAAAIVILLLRPGAALPPPVPPIEIEMVQQIGERRGAPPPPAPAPARDAQAAPPDTTSPSPRPSAPTPSRPQTPSQRAAPEVNLGNARQDLDPLSVTGDNVVPPGPDTRYRNLPPHYPASAVRSGAEGTVQLVARIAPNGLPLSVGVVESSGNTDLDEEARRAVLLWRFRPALEAGRAVAYDYVVNIRFALGDR